jgi:glycolate oxidase iron-sulfur subunit
MREKFSQDKLDPCISCGYCLPACPTYQLTGKEESSPRGRITLMRAVQNDKLPALDLLNESTFCLGCRACEPVCPAGVEYGVLLEEMREITWQGKNRPLIVRALFMAVGNRFGIWSLGLFSPVAKNRKAQADLHLMYGCFERRLFPEVSRAVAQLAPEVSCSSTQGCCGALHAHNGDMEKGKSLAQALGAKLPGTILTTAGGCAAHLSSVIGRDRVQEFSEWWINREVNLKPISQNGGIIRVGLQDSCHLRNGMGVFAEPRKVLKQLGDYVEVPGSGDCCGAAGTYALLQKKNSRKVVSQKIADIKELDLDYIATLNPGCTRQLATELRRAKVKTKVIHLAQLVAMSEQ